MLNRPGNEPTELFSVVRDEILAAGLGITMERDGNGVTGLRVFAGRVTDILFERDDT